MVQGVPAMAGSAGQPLLVQRSHCSLNSMWRPVEENIVEGSHLRMGRWVADRG